MKVTLLIAAALCAPLASAKDSSSLDVASVISYFYGTTPTPTVAASISTSLASALHSVQTSWEDSPAYTSAQSAIISAAPSDVAESISKSGFIYQDITSEDWYTKSVPKSDQSAVSKEIGAINSVFTHIVGTVTSTGGVAPAKITGVAVMGVVGVVGAMVAL